MNMPFVSNRIIVYYHQAQRSGKRFLVHHIDDITCFSFKKDRKIVTENCYIIPVNKKGIDGYWYI